MTSGWVIGGVLVFIAMLDAAFAGFRASCGRTGRVDHRLHDRVGARRGLLVAAALLIPLAVIICLDAAFSPSAMDGYLKAGRVMLWMFIPYGALVLTALLAYLTLDWRRRFLASVVILGPFTLLRPLVVAAALVGVVLLTDRASVALAALAASIAVLAVEPVTGRLWYTSNPVSH